MKEWDSGNEIDRVEKTLHIILLLDQSNMIRLYSN